MPWTPSEFSRKNECRMSWVSPAICYPADSAPLAALPEISILAMVTHGDAWHMDVQERLDPLEWDS
jgi:hypothetical protein